MLAGWKCLWCLQRYYPNPYIGPKQCFFIQNHPPTDDVEMRRILRASWSARQRSVVRVRALGGGHSEQRGPGDALRFASALLEKGIFWCPTVSLCGTQIIKCFLYFPILCWRLPECCVLDRGSSVYVSPVPRILMPIERREMKMARNTLQSIPPVHCFVHFTLGYL
jgi:hypothetical protein